MFKNYLAITFRQMLQHKLYSVINIVGLAIGMTCCILILLFVYQELSYENAQPDANRIFRIVRESRSENADPIFLEGTSGPLGPALERDFPEIETVARMWPMDDSWIRHNNRGFTQTQLMVDANFLLLFSLPLIKGDAQTALKLPYSMLITEKMAQKYFGNQDPIGKTLHVDQRYAKGDYRVTGILKNPPHNTFLQFDCISATQDPENTRWAWLNWKPTSQWRPIQTIIRLSKDQDPNVLSQKISDAITQYMGEHIRVNNTYHLQPIKRIHLYSRQDYGIATSGDISYVTLASAIALLILLIACINFTNLATARSAERSREIGMRKVVGATKGALVLQFLSEAMLLSFLALLLALILSALSLPTFNIFMGKQLTLNLFNTHIFFGLSGLTLCVGILAGLYPAFFLSTFQPVKVLKGPPKAGAWNIFLRKGLIVFQFTISIVLIICTLIIDKQRSHLQNKHLGFNKNQVVVLPMILRDRSLNAQSEAIKNRLLRHPNVLKATTTLRSIEEEHTMRVVRPEGITGNGLRMYQVLVDEDFTDTFEIELVQGRLPSKSIANDANAFMLNETAVKQLGWTDPIGKRFEYPLFRIKGTVIGVVKDYHFGSQRTALGPAFFMKMPPQAAYNYINLRIRSNSLAETLVFLKKEWESLIPNQPFEYTFLDDRFTQLYHQEQRLEKMFTTFALLTIFIACLGILALSAFTTEQRTKEIGVRKVLGASLFNIVKIVAKDFVWLILIANLIAWPIVYLTMQQWLQNFASRTSLDPIAFFFGGLLTLTLALLIVSYQAIKAAATNPIDALKYE